MDQRVSYPTMGQTQGRELPYDVGEQFTCLTSKTIWSVHTGKKQVSASLGLPLDVYMVYFRVVGSQ